MKKTELIRLSVGNIGNAWAFMMIFLFLPEYYLIDNIFTGAFKNTLSFSVITISFTAGALAFLFAGILSDKTVTRLGKRRPYFLLAIPAGISYMLIGLIPPASSQTITFITITTAATAFAVLDRIQYCNFWSLYMDRTKPSERVTTSVIFNLFGLVGTIGALFLTPIFIRLGITFPHILLIVGCVYITTIMFAFLFGPREDFERIQQLQKIERESYFRILKSTLRNRNFSFYLMATFFFVLGYSISVLNLIPIIELHNIDMIIMLIALFPTAIFYFVFFDRLAKKRGRLPAFQLILLIGIITLPICIFLGLAGTGILLFVQVYIIIILVLNVVIGVITFQYAILMDLTPEGQEATYAGLFLFMIVIPIPVGSAITGPIIDLLADPILIWPTQMFSYAIIFLITALCLVGSYFFLRKIQIDKDVT